MINRVLLKHPSLLKVIRSIVVFSYVLFPLNKHLNIFHYYYFKERICYFFSPSLLVSVLSFLQSVFVNVQHVSA